MKTNRPTNPEASGMQIPDAEKQQPVTPESPAGEKKVLTEEKRKELFKRIAELQPYLESRVARQLGLSYRDAHDVASGAIIHAMEKISELEDEAYLKKWLTVVVMHYVVDHQRNEIRKKRLLNEFLYDPSNIYKKRVLKHPLLGMGDQRKVFVDKIDLSPNPEQLVARKYLVKDLSPKQRHAIEMHYFQDMHVEDMVEALKSMEPDITESAVKLRLWAARKNIKKKLGETKGI
jgi:RNA polymerase sigma factor (sigma-70 family)